MTKSNPIRTTNAANPYRRVARGLLWALALCLAVSPARADDRQEGELTLHAGGFLHDRGQAVASLFYEGDDVFGKPRARVVTSIQQGKARFVFARLPYGNYAVTVFHDENGNNDLDHNFLHFPAEPLGFSNGFKLTLFSGMPSFEKLRFAFGPGTMVPEITVK